MENSSKEGGQYRGVLEAAERFMARWHEHEATLGGHDSETPTHRCRQSSKDGVGERRRQTGQYGARVTTAVGRTCLRSYRKLLWLLRMRFDGCDLGAFWCSFLSFLSYMERCLACFHVFAGREPVLGVDFCSYAWFLRFFCCCFLLCLSPLLRRGTT